jgi:hypothetical protein
MKVDISTAVAALVKNFTKCKLALASFVRARIEARKRSIARDKEFYRKLHAYCRANNLSAICEDDWKTAAYSQ